MFLFLYTNTSFPHSPPKILGRKGTLCFSRFHHSLMPHTSQFHSLVYLADPWKYMGLYSCHIGLPWWLSGKESISNVGDSGEKRVPWGGNGNHSSILAWEIPWTEAVGRLWSMGSQGVQFSSVHFSHWVVSDSAWPHGPQHARTPCPSPTPTVYPNSCPLTSSVMPESLWPHGQ